MQNTRTFRRTFFLTIAGILVICAANALRAQAPLADTKPPAFEVASVKHNTSSADTGTSWISGLKPLASLEWSYPLVKGFPSGTRRCATSSR
jgi:hypothetical protein